MQRLLKVESVVEVIYVAARTSKYMYVQIYLEIYVDTWRGRGSLDVRKASQCRMSGRGLRFPKLTSHSSNLTFPKYFSALSFTFLKKISHLKSHFPQTFLCILTIWGQFCYLLLTQSKHGWIFFIIYHCGQSRSSSY